MNPWKLAVLSTGQKFCAGFALFMLFGLFCVDYRGAAIFAIGLLVPALVYAIMWLLLRLVDRR